MKNTIFITGGSGYVGSMLVLHFAQLSNVEKIISLDRKSPPKNIFKILSKEEKAKIIFLMGDMSCDDWQEKLASYEPDIVIHCAWQIRSLYRNKNEMKQWYGNIVGSDKIFDFVFQNTSVKKFIHFSTVASYSALKENTLTKFFTEEDPLRYSDFRYAYEKKEAEERLYGKYCMQKTSRPDLQISVVRPASITGEYGRSLSKFGIQSVLSGKSKKFFHKILAKILFFAPLTKKWARQFIHEEDVVGTIDALSFGKKQKESSVSHGDYEIYNLCPPGDIMKAEDMAKAVNKRLLLVNPEIIRGVFFALWHLSRGLVPTSCGGWKAYCYPVVVDGSKITKVCGYKYKHGPKESFTKIKDL